MNIGIARCSTTLCSTVRRSSAHYFSFCHSLLPLDQLVILAKSTLPPWSGESKDIVDCAIKWIKNTKADMNIDITHRSSTCCLIFSFDQLIVSGVSTPLSSSKSDFHVDWIVEWFP